MDYSDPTKFMDVRQYMRPREQLVGMGFPEGAVDETLAAHNGDVGAAAAALAASAPAAAPAAPKTKEEKRAAKAAAKAAAVVVGPWRGAF